jgi:hypothetical protein
MASKATQTSRMNRVVTLELMRKRAEHNDGVGLLDLEELALHQEDFERIRNYTVGAYMWEDITNVILTEQYNFVLALLTAK